MVRLGISGCNVVSCIVGPTSDNEWIEHNRGNSSPNKKKRAKLHQKEFLGENSSAGIIGGSSTTSGWSDSFGV